MSSLVSAQPAAAGDAGTFSDGDDDYPTYGEVLADDLRCHLATEGAGLSAKFQAAIREAINALT